jgi:hypothetical protein
LAVTEVRNGVITRDGGGFTHGPLLRGDELMAVLPDDADEALSLALRTVEAWMAAMHHYAGTCAQQERVHRSILPEYEARGIERAPMLASQGRRFEFLR